MLTAPIKHIASRCPKWNEAIAFMDIPLPEYDLSEDELRDILKMMGIVMATMMVVDRMTKGKVDMVGVIV